MSQHCQCATWSEEHKAGVPSFCLRVPFMGCPEDHASGGVRCLHTSELNPGCHLLLLWLWQALVAAAGLLVARWLAGGWRDFEKREERFNTSITPCIGVTAKSEVFKY